MKYCLSSRNEKKYLELVDEIKVQYRDKNIIPDLLEDYPEADIILEIFDIETEKDWEKIKRFNILSQGRLICCVSDFGLASMCKDAGIKFYYGYPIKTYYELNAAIEYGVSYIILGPPLFFDMDYIKTKNVPIRAIPNIAYGDGFPRDNGLYGTWIRPEDVDAYEPYIDVFEFEDCDLRKERALFRIYNKKAWSGPLELIITNFRHSGVNRMVLPDLIQHRLNCKQRCQSGGSCRACERTFKLANPELITEYLESTEEF